MKYLNLTLLIILVSTSLLVAQDKTATTGPAFLSIPSNARGTAMGGAFTAISDDENSLFWNPGGLAQVKRNIASFSNTTAFVDTRYQDFSAAFYLGTNGTVGIKAMILNYGDIDVTTINNPEGTGERINPMDISMSVTYSRYLTTAFSFGITGKYVNQRISSSEANGVGVDLGILYKSDFKNLRIGMSITNFGTDMQMMGDDLTQAIDIDADNNGNNNRLGGYLNTNQWPMPLNFRVGLAMDVLESKFNKLTLAIDAKHPSDNSEAPDLGFEYGFRNMIFLRGGYRNLLTSIPSDGGVTAGFGLNYDLNSVNSIRIGYSFQHHKYLQSPQIWTLAVTF